MRYYPTNFTFIVRAPIRYSPISVCISEKFEKAKKILLYHKKVQVQFSIVLFNTAVEYKIIISKTFFTGPQDIKSNIYRLFVFLL